ncbi:inner membrane protein associated with alginate biosynthesis [Escherichia coli]|uniref:Inner membrane protein associated with alginate biosynthesis n=1 Tax=Escherichia coli TaxID=562 RepID=A0A2X1KEV7_ECOLX|nr:inner membrane protein associated with alginate biosynthesis [Escherichia coli]
MGLVIKARARCAGSAVDWCFSKNEKLLYRRADSTFPDLCAYRALYCFASERGIEALRATIIFSMWSIIPYFVYLVSAVVFHRNDALARRFLLVLLRVGG